MTNRITAARNAVKQALTGEVTVDDRAVPVHDHVPERLVAPCLVIVPDEPYLTVGQTFNELKVRLRIVAVAKPATNRVLSTQLDELLDSTCAVLNATGGVDNVSRPGVEVINQQSYVTSAVSITAPEE